MAMAWGVYAEETLPEESADASAEAVEVIEDPAAENAEDPAAEAVDDTATEDTGISILQGYLNGESYTFRLDTLNQTASIADTLEDGTLNLISGGYTTDEAGTLTVTAEDGTTQSWTATSVSNCQTTAVGDAGEITLVLADPNMEENINDFAWYAGSSAEGDAYSYGISLDCTQLIFGFYAVDDPTLYETRFTLNQTEGGEGVIAGTASDETGNVYPFSFELVDGSPLHVNITLNGETCEASAVEARVFAGYQEEAAE